MKYFYTVLKLIVTAIVLIAYLHYFFPQSWGFYTVQSNSPLYDIYRVDNGIAGKNSLIKNNLIYGMGVSRNGKLLYKEIYSIINKNNLQWKLLNEDSLNYITRHGTYSIIAKANEYTAFKGNFLITKTDRPSYLTLKNGGPFHPSKQYVLTDIR